MAHVVRHFYVCVPYFLCVPEGVTECLPQSDHTFLFDWVAASEHTAEASFSEENGFRRRFRYLNGVPLNDANFDLEANVVAPEGSDTQFSWVAEIPVTDSNLMTRMREARARWKVENDTFNTRKSQGYHFERNFGHGKQDLATVLMHLMKVAFLFDQILQRCCRLFEAALTAAKSKTRLWRKLRNRFDLGLIPSWEALYRSIIHPPEIPLWLDTS